MTAFEKWCEGLIDPDDIISESDWYAKQVLTPDQYDKREAIKLKQNVEAAQLTLF